MHSNRAADSVADLFSIAIVPDATARDYSNRPLDTMKRRPTSREVTYIFCSCFFLPLFTHTYAIYKFVQIFYL